MPSVLKWSVVGLHGGQGHPIQLHGTSITQKHPKILSLLDSIGVLKVVSIGLSVRLMAMTRKFMDCQIWAPELLAMAIVLNI